MIGQGIYRFLKHLVTKERSINKLTFSFCIGLYIAFSPFIGFHTIMIFLFSWLFSLNTAVTFTVAYIINNPWTMVPVYSSGYFFGYWLLSYFFSVDILAHNPSWMTCINDPLHSYIGIEGVSFWAFLIGGNILGLGLSMLFYPIIRIIFARIVTRMYTS